MKGLQYYILEGRILKPAEYSDWARWFENVANRRVAETKLPNGVYISTVCLGIDHSFGEGTPQVFETMIFGGRHDTYQQRYATWDEAQAGHQQAVKLAKEGLIKLLSNRH